MTKRVIFSAKLDHEVFKKVAKELQTLPNINVILHDPCTDFLDLENMDKFFEGVSDLIVKVRGDCSLDLLHYAKLHKIRALHNVDTVLMCKNKVALDHALRLVFQNYKERLSSFLLPRSWTSNPQKRDVFKKWASSRLPIVLKSHFQHDKYMRFTFLVNELKEIDEFYERYAQFLYYDLYIQEFIECDQIDRKIYVIGDKVLGIQRENPIYIFLRDRPDSINVDEIKRDNFKVTKEIKELAMILSKELKLKIFGFDLIKPLDSEKFYLVDLNDFPGFRGIPNIEKTFIDFFKQYLTT
ncbi:MAG: hypothetical protein EU521_01260 [Promethearchaeota archaeon]|nr:MAG: hypothetical protein EU521_01260 [Candidatus Lokiarchaeota archaeon]